MTCYLLINKNRKPRWSGKGEGHVCYYLILLREAQVVIGFEALDVVGQLTHGDGRMFSHSWRRKKDGKC